MCLGGTEGLQNTAAPLEKCPFIGHILRVSADKYSEITLAPGTVDNRGQSRY